MKGFEGGGGRGYVALSSVEKRNGGRLGGGEVGGDEALLAHPPWRLGH